MLTLQLQLQYWLCRQGSQRTQAIRQLTWDVDRATVNWPRAIGIFLMSIEYSSKHLIMITWALIFSSTFGWPCLIVTPFKFQVQRDYDREEKEDFESDREDSATLSEDITSSPCAQHNGSYKTHSEEDASLCADNTKWQLQHHRN